MLTTKDDRTEEQKQTHTCLIKGYDTFLSGWPSCYDHSYAAWACKLADSDKVLKWVKSRSDMLNVRIVSDNYRPAARNGKSHYHIYAVTENHPALKGF